MPHPHNGWRSSRTEFQTSAGPFVTRVYVKLTGAQAGAVTFYIVRPDGRNHVYAFNPAGDLTNQAEGENKKQALEALQEIERRSAV